MSFFIRYRASIGVRKSARIVEVTTPHAIVMPYWYMKRPIRPFINASGINTATSTSDVEITANPISFAPSLAACMGVFPC